METLYISYNDYEVLYDTTNHCFEINVKNNKGVLKSKSVFSSADFTYERSSNAEEEILSVKEGERELIFTLSKKGISVNIPDKLLCYLKTDADTFSMDISESDIVSAGYGPATSNKDNCLYSRDNDTALCINGTFGYDHERDCYTCLLSKDTHISLKENVLADEYMFDYKKINKNSTFSKPPAGWMTWYATKFDACEGAVLDNVNWQMENLKDYGANVIWVDWEWYHDSLEGIRDDGVDTFHPDPVRYPNGLKYVADKIKEAGFTPALWIGFTHDCSVNDYARENPEIVLLHKQSWCGQYFYDFTHPKYLNEFLPKALSQIFDWGYEAIKFDTLPLCTRYHEENHEKMYDPTLSTKEAYRQLIRKTRDFIGEDMYMLSCSCPKDSSLLYAADMFDAARVGEDIFEWSEFLKEGVDRVLRFQPLNNVVLYADPDNVILREEFNTINQAKSRAYFVSMLGLPLNFGDYLPKLATERVNILKQCLPTLDIHPKNLIYTKRSDILVTNLAICVPWDSYNVISVFNTTDKSAEKSINFADDLGLEDKDYLVFDYTSGQFVGKQNNLTTTLEPHETKVFCIRRDMGDVQLLSTSRHISQGAAEIKSVVNTSDTMCITSSLIKDAPYEIYLYVPSGTKIVCPEYDITNIDKNVIKLTFVPNETNEYEFSIKKERI